MGYVIIALLFVHLLSICLLGITVYPDKNIGPSFWAVLALMLPIVNTIVLIYLVAGHGSGFKDFIKELKNARKGD
jgi:hypothetical protein